MVSKTKKGNYYRLKAKKWLEADGYLVVNAEYRYRVFTPKGTFYITKDIFAADLICVNDKEMIFVQVKSNKGDVLKGIKDMLEIPWPDCECLKRWVLLWEPRAKQPCITEVDKPELSM